ncbi:hypothetical protein [Streptomyces liangshanensis]|uniref:Tetratricopeptide repeat protein n=1 Tax=Streptomyces liangshanensis TaxID=2717324 RepID=A0A6G9H6G5_9ACTN|nr:hypothetical protein [Streptomyces liangshanensis]QIQ05896.1 hypothetical protein HA039_29550 [Streptomyces liangshanensis]
MTEQREASGDTFMTRIGQAVMLLHGGDREEARNRFGALWAEIGETGDALQRCTLAHYMADTQDDAGDELAWDLRALTAADGQGAEESDRRAPSASAPGEARGTSPEMRAFYPTLHLNLAADYLKLQRPEAARLHLDRARTAADVLGDSGADGYGNGVRAGIDRLERLLGQYP